jgi:hypothetical protein
MYYAESTLDNCRLSSWVNTGSGGEACSVGNGYSQIDHTSRFTRVAGDGSTAVVSCTCLTPNPFPRSSLDVDLPLSCCVCFIDAWCLCSSIPAAFWWCIVTMTTVRTMMWISLVCLWTDSSCSLCSGGIRRHVSRHILWKANCLADNVIRRARLCVAHHCHRHEIYQHRTGHREGGVQQQPACSRRVLWVQAFPVWFCEMTGNGEEARIGVCG